MLARTVVVALCVAAASAGILESSGSGWGPENVTQHSGYIAVNGEASDLCLCRVRWTRVRSSSGLTLRPPPRPSAECRTHLLLAVRGPSGRAGCEGRRAHVFPPPSCDATCRNARPPARAVAQRAFDGPTRALDDVRNLVGRSAAGTLPSGARGTPQWRTWLQLGAGHLRREWSVPALQRRHCLHQRVRVEQQGQRAVHRPADRHRFLVCQCV